MFFRRYINESRNLWPGFGEEEVDEEFNVDNDKNANGCMFVDFDEDLFKNVNNRNEQIYKILKYIRINNKCPPLKLKIDIDKPESEINDIIEKIYKQQLTERSVKDAKDMLDFFAIGYLNNKLPKPSSECYFSNCLVPNTIFSLNRLSDRVLHNVSMSVSASPTPKIVTHTRCLLLPPVASRCPPLSLCRYLHRRRRKS